MTAAPSGPDPAKSGAIPPQTPGVRPRVQKLGSDPTREIQSDEFTAAPTEEQTQAGASSQVSRVENEPSSPRQGSLASAVVGFLQRRLQSRVENGTNPAVAEEALDIALTSLGIENPDAPQSGSFNSVA